MTLYDHLPVNTRKAKLKDIFFETDDRVFIKHSVDFFEKRGECYARFNTRFCTNDGYAALKDSIEKGNVYVYPEPENSL